MKKLFTFTCALLFATFALQAQESTFLKGDKVLNIGIGFGSASYSGSGYSTAVPPISASFEYGIAEEIANKGSIGIGGYIGFASYKWNWAGWSSSFSDLVFGARGSFHWPLVDKLDTYTGLLIGYEVINWKDTYTGTGTYSSSTSGGIWAWYLGGRYYFTEKFSGMLELGYGISYLTLGVGIKL